MSRNQDWRLLLDMAYRIDQESYRRYGSGRGMPSLELINTEILLDIREAIFEMVELQKQITGEVMVTRDAALEKKENKKLP